MVGKFDDISVQDAMRLAQSDVGQQLLSVIKKQNGAKYQKATSEAAAGNYEQMKETLEDLIASAEVRALLEQLRGLPNE